MKKPITMVSTPHYHTLRPSGCSLLSLFALLPLSALIVASIFFSLLSPSVHHLCCCLLRAFESILFRFLFSVLLRNFFFHFYISFIFVCRSTKILFCRFSVLLRLYNKLYGDIETVSPSVFPVCPSVRIYFTLLYLQQKWTKYKMCSA